MRTATSPRLHFFVCANRRLPTDPLGTGCADRGEAVYASLKSAVARHGAVATVWVTKTHCLGMCPRRGAAVARHPSTSPILTEVEVEDVPRLFEESERADRAKPRSDWEAIERELASAEALQAAKVLALARRLNPRLTAEDIQNPHDFPELDDPDWHYADGVLTGIQSIASALRAQKNRS